ncbi:hypothetical protein VIGAN_UM008800 [Vigna angularis var. angularis]|uniref:Uncharacterized protein n=1 Tax=Vigna angularis var. angularis TaxID=157739 RepID=A0A0S3TD53_PHAAN|nr:hypothetical protein VIGAN_UM008800 [Vigna angularis var. angularis]
MLSDGMPLHIVTFFVRIKINDNDCGYYVCRCIKEIITYCEGGTIPTDYFHNCIYQPYRDNKLLKLGKIDVYM